MFLFSLSSSLQVLNIKFNLTDKFITNTLKYESLFLAAKILSMKENFSLVSTVN